MQTKHLITLELPKILERLAGYCAFSASETLARALAPSTEMAEVSRRLAETTQAKDALEKLDLLDVGGARDIRERVDFTNHGGVLEPQEFLTIRDTLEAGKRVQRTLMRYNAVYPQLTAITNLIEPCAALVNEINRCVDDGGEVRDNASPALASARREVRIVHDRLLQKLQRMVADTNTATYLMESLVTQRGGRYVIPVRADFKGRIPGVVHDQSSSGQTLFIEPLATLDLNNEWRELQLAEARERLRVLTALSAQVSADSELISRTIDCLAQFDLALAKAKYSEAIRGTAAEIVSRDKTPQGEAAFMLRQSRHPLLNMNTAVPIDVHLGMRDEGGQESARVLVITGPNTGGKTVALKTVGLLALMNQCGLHIPAEQARLPVFEAVYADIGDEQSIEQSLSTFSSHLT
ncbi:MAG: endonuclease MutS2, partial [Anaerolineae bacterium]